MDLIQLPLMACSIAQPEMAVPDPLLWLSCPVPLFSCSDPNFSNPWLHRCSSESKDFLQSGGLGHSKASMLDDIACSWSFQAEIWLDYFGSGSGFDPLACISLARWSLHLSATSIAISSSTWSHCCRPRKSREIESQLAFMCYSMLGLNNHDMEENLEPRLGTWLKLRAQLDRVKFFTSLTAQNSNCSREFSLSRALATPIGNSYFNLGHNFWAGMGSEVFQLLQTSHPRWDGEWGLQPCDNTKGGTGHHFFLGSSGQCDWQWSHRTRKRTETREAPLSQNFRCQRRFR